MKVNLQLAIGKRKLVFYKKMVYLIIPYSLLTIHSSAQRISATVDREKILLGEQVTLQLKLEDFNPRTSFLSEWFKIPDTINHIEVVKREAIDTIDIGGLSTYIQKVILTSFDSGKWQLPPLILNISDNSSEKETQLKTNNIFLEVLPVDVSNLTDYHDIKDIIEVEVHNNPFIIGTLVFFTILSVAMLLWLMKRRRHTQTEIKPMLKGTALERALAKIETLQKNNYLHNGEVKKFYTALDVIYRQYLTEQFNIRAMQSSSDELMIVLSSYLQKENTRTKFFQLLRLSDAVKFAKYIPGEEQNKEALYTATASLQNFDMLAKQTTTNVNRMV